MIIELKGKEFKLKFGTAAMLRFQKNVDLDKLQKGEIELEDLVELAVCGIRKSELPEDEKGMKEFKDQLFEMLDDNFKAAQDIIEEMTSMVKLVEEAKK